MEAPVVRFEFFGYFRAMTGKAEHTIVLEGCPEPTVGDALKAVDRVFNEKSFRIIEDGTLKTGVIVFLKHPSGKTVRATADQRLSENPAVLVLSNLMGGG